MNRTLSRLILIAPWMLVLGACGSSQGDGEAPGTTSQAYTYTSPPESIDAKAFTTLVSPLTPGNSTLSVANDIITFTPSSNMMNLLGMAPTTSPSVPQNVGSDGCNYTSSLTSVSFASPLSMALTGSEIALTATLDAVVNFTHQGTSIYCPNSFQIALNNAPMQIPIISQNGNLAVGTATVTVSGYTSATCGAFDWCAGIVNSYSGEATGPLNTQLQTMAAGFITPQFQTNFFNGLANHELSTLPAGASSASVVPGSFSIANSALNFTLTYSDAPPALTCTAAANCTGNSPDETITVSCTSPSVNSNFTVQFQQLVNGAWQNVGTSSALSSLSWSTTVPTNGAEQTLTYQALSEDSAGTSQSNSVAVVMNSSCCYSEAQACGSSCGTISVPNGCGGTMTCDQGCTAGRECSSNECVCAPRSCPAGQKQSAATCLCVANQCTSLPECCVAGGGSWINGKCT